MTQPHSVTGQCIVAAHGEIAKFAVERFMHDGRGVVMIDFPIAPGTNVVAATMHYHDLTSVRALTAEITDSGLEDADILLRMVETYDPETQAVVMASAGGGFPVFVTIRLDQPTIIVDDPDGVR
jgi:hypothetical protein